MTDIHVTYPEALLEAPAPPRRETSEYAVAAHSTLERELVRALHHERLAHAQTQRWLDDFQGSASDEALRAVLAEKRVTEAVELGQKRAEGMRDHAVACFDEVLSKYKALVTPGLPDVPIRIARLDFIDLLGARVEHGRPDWKFGDRVEVRLMPDAWDPGVIIAPPDAVHPHSARVVLENGKQVDVSVGLLRRPRREGGR